MGTQATNMAPGEPPQPPPPPPAPAAEITTVRGLCISAGLVFLSVGGQPLMNYLSGDTSLKTILPSAMACLVGSALILLGVFWHPRKDTKSGFIQTLAKWSVSPIPYALMLVFLLLYFETLAVGRNMELSSMRNDGQSITEALDRFVLPRQLSEGQINTIGSFLQQFPPQDYELDVVVGDEEAGQYRANLQRALEKGGWHLKGINYVPPSMLTIGLRTDFSQTPEHASAQSDYRRPNSSMVLQEAFGLAGVRLDSIGSGSGQTITQDLMKITIGSRRRDAYALPCEPK